MVLVVVARYRRGQGRIGGGNGAGERAQIGPLVKTKSHSSLGRFDFAVLGAVGLIPFSDVYALVARGDADVVSTADVLP